MKYRSSKSSSRSGWLSNLVLLTMSLSFCSAFSLYFLQSFVWVDNSAECEAKVQQLHSLLAKVGSERTEWSQLMDKTTVPRDKFDKLKSKALQISADLVRVRSQVDSFQAEAQSAAKLKSEEGPKAIRAIAKLNQTYAIALKRAKEQVDKARSDAKLCEQANEKLEARLSSTSNQLAKANAIPKSDPEELKAMEKESALVREQLGQVKEENRMLKEKIESLKEQAQIQLASSMTTKQEQGEVLELEEAADGKQHEKPQESHGDSAEELEKLRSLVQHLRNEQAKLEQSCQDRVKTLAGEKEALLAQASKLQKTAETAQASNQKLAQEKLSLEKTVADLQASLKKSQQMAELQPHKSDFTNDNNMDSDLSGLGFSSQQQRPMQPLQPMQPMQPQPMQPMQPQPMQPMQQQGFYQQGNMGNSFPSSAQASGANGFSQPNMFASNQQGFDPCQGQRKFEFNADKPGPFYIEQQVDSARRCRDMCLRDFQCRSWVYIKSLAACQLKNQMIQSVANQCCVAGMRC